MRSHTHLVFAALASSFFLSTVYIEALASKILFFSFLFLGALLPDIDQTDSVISRKLWPFSRLASLFTKHRGIFHSLWIPGALILLAFFSKLSVTYSLPLAALAIGYTSHLFADAITPHGIHLLPPLRLKIHGPIKTGTLLESILFLVMLGWLVLRSF